MNSVRSGSLFGQILSIINRKHFERLVVEHKTDRGANGSGSTLKKQVLAIFQFTGSEPVILRNRLIAKTDGQTRGLCLRQSQYRAALSANAEMTTLYWDIGRMIAAR